MLHTSFCTATRIEVEPVRFIRAADGKSVISAQLIVVTLDDGSRSQLSIHLTEGCTTLRAGDAVVYPALSEVPA